MPRTEVAEAEDNDVKGTEVSKIKQRIRDESLKERRNNFISHLFDCDNYKINEQELYFLLIE